MEDKPICKTCKTPHDWTGFTHADWSNRCSCGCRCPEGQPPCSDGRGHDGPLEVVSSGGPRRTTYECRACGKRGEYYELQ